MYRHKVEVQLHVCTTFSDIALLWSLEPELVTYANFSVWWRRNWPTNRKSHWSSQPSNGFKWQMSGIRMCEANPAEYTRFSLGLGPGERSNQPKWRLTYIYEHYFIRV